jgi:hypothetical protein
MVAVLAEVTRGGSSARFAVMGGGSRFVGLVLGRGLTLRQADGCAGQSSRDCELCEA